jgi:hypothetical protein
VSISTRFPLTPLALRIPAALLDNSSPMVGTFLLEEEVEVLLDDELVLVELAAEDALVVEELEALEEAAVGMKLLFVVPKPSAAASLPLP